MNRLFQRSVGSLVIGIALASLLAKPAAPQFPPAPGTGPGLPETIEASLQLSEAVLVDVGVAMGPVIASIHEVRAEMQAAIKTMAPDAAVRTLGRRRLRDRL